MQENKLYVFYHIYADGKWEEPVKEFLLAYRKWGLIDQIGVLRVGLVGNQNNQTKVIQYLINERIQFEPESAPSLCRKELFDQKRHIPTKTRTLCIWGVQSP